MIGILAYDPYYELCIRKWRHHDHDDGDGSESVYVGVFQSYDDTMPQHASFLCR